MRCYPQDRLLRLDSCYLSYLIIGPTNLYPIFINCYERVLAQRQDFLLSRGFVSSSVVRWRVLVASTLDLSRALGLYVYLLGSSELEHALGARVPMMWPAPLF